MVVDGVHACCYAKGKRSRRGSMYFPLACLYYFKTYHRRREVEVVYFYFSICIYIYICGGGGDGGGGRVVYILSRGGEGE